MLLGYNVWTLEWGIGRTSREGDEEMGPGWHFSQQSRCWHEGATWFLLYSLKLYPSLQRICVKFLPSCPTLVTVGTVVCQAPLSMGFSRRKYCSGWPCPPPGDLPDSGIEPMSVMSPALAAGFFTTSASWEAHLADNGQWQLLRATEDNREVKRWRKKTPLPPPGILDYLKKPCLWREDTLSCLLCTYTVWCSLQSREHLNVE